MTAQLTSYGENFQVYRDDGSSPITEVNKAQHIVLLGHEHNTGDCAPILNRKRRWSWSSAGCSIRAASPVFAPDRNGDRVIGAAYALGYTTEARLNLGQRKNLSANPMRLWLPCSDCGL